MPGSNSAHVFIARHLTQRRGSRRRLSAALTCWAASGLILCSSDAPLTRAEYYLGNPWLWAVAIPVLLLACLHIKRSSRVILATLLAMPVALNYLLRLTAKPGLKPRHQARRTIIDHTT